MRHWRLLSQEAEQQFLHQELLSERMTLIDHALARLKRVFNSWQNDRLQAILALYVKG